jgi:hypothetical protein
MGEAFIFGSGGGATVEHIVLTNATSHTFQLTNPKRTNCKVFGSITSSETTGSYIGIEGTLDCKFRLYGSQYVVYSKDGDRSITGGSWQTTYRESTEFDKDATITRNDGSITIELTHDYRKVYQEGYDSGWDETYLELSRTNTIDIYVVDYD